MFAYLYFVIFIFISTSVYIYIHTHSQNVILIPQVGATKAVDGSGVYGSDLEAFLLGFRSWNKVSEPTPGCNQP